MHKCRELSKLPKAPRISSVNFRRQTPGSANGLWQTSKPDNRLDRNHPIDLLPGKQKAFLWAPPCRAFTLGAIPMGLLLSPIKYIRSSGHNRSPFLFDAQQRIVDVQSFDSWRARLARGSSTGTVSPMILNEPHHTRVSMSLQAQSNGTFRPHQRVQILRRFKTAVGLIATRGAAAKSVGVNGRLRLVLDGADAAEGWILQGWTYYLRPSLELLKMPYPELVNLLRPVLRDLWERGNKLEVQWTAASLEAQNTPRTRGSRTPSPTESRPPKHSRSSMPDAASSPTRSRYSRQNRPPSDPDVARDAPDNDTTTGYGARPDSLRGKKRGQRSPVPSELFPTVPDFDPFPVVRGTPEAFASPGRAPTATSPALGDLDPRSLLAEPNFDPFPAIFSSAPSSTAGPVSPVAPIDPGPQENIWQASQGLRAEPDFDPFPSARPTPTPTVYSASAGGPLSTSTFAGASGAPSSSPDRDPATSMRSAKAKAKIPKPTDWWAVGRKIEAAVRQDGAEGATRWDTLKSSSTQAQRNTDLDADARPSVPKKERDGKAKEKEKRDSAQGRLARMLFQHKEVARPDSQDRKARQIPWQTHRLEEK